jgi:hypothetical protein
MDRYSYAATRVAAIVLGLVMTSYSAVLSFEHFHTILGPLVSISAAVLLVLAAYPRRYARALWVSGMVAALMSAVVVLDRVTATDAARLQVTKDTNHARLQPVQALQDAKDALAKAESEAKAECLTGRKRRCLELEDREAKARERVETARGKVAAAGSTMAENTVAERFGSWAAAHNMVLPIALPVWLEVTAPLLIAYGFAPLPRSTPATPSPEPAPEHRPEPRPVRKPEPEPEVEPEPDAEPARKRRGRKASYGTRAYWLQRLDQVRPDLAKQVRAGKLSANKAALMSGLRKQALKVVA